MTEQLIHLADDVEGVRAVSTLCKKEGWIRLEPFRKDQGLGNGIYVADSKAASIFFHYTFADQVATCQKCIDKKLEIYHVRIQDKINKYKKN